MYTRVSGPRDRSQEEVQRGIVSFQEDFDSTLSNLKGVKRQYRDLKAQRIQRKLRQMKEEKQMASYKFSKVEKQQPFISRARFGDSFQKDMVEKHDAHRDHRDLEKLLFPDRALSIPRDGRAWKLNTSTLNFIGKLSLDTSPNEKFTISTLPSQRTSEPKWSPVTTTLKIFEETRPMVEETMTPRATQKLITLERSLGPGFEVRSPHSTVTSKTGSLGPGSSLSRRSGMFRKKKAWNPGNPFLKEFTATGYYDDKRPFVGKKGGV